MYGAAWSTYTFPWCLVGGGEEEEGRRGVGFFELENRNSSGDVDSY